MKFTIVIPEGEYCKGCLLLQFHSVYYCRLSGVTLGIKPENISNGGNIKRIDHIIKDGDCPSR